MKQLMLLAALAVAPLAAETVNAVEHLERTRRLFLESVKGLSQAQWQFKPAPHRPEPPAEKVDDAKVVALLTDRSFKAGSQGAPGFSETVVANLKEQSK